MFQNNRFYTIALMSASLLLLPACWPFGSEQQTQKPELVIINVLDTPEFNDCHITGSIHMSFDAFESRIPSLSKQNHYVLYCADYMCMSSGFCAKLLQDAKFEHVWAYEGGMAEWFQKGYPYEGPAQEDYLKSENVNMADADDHSEVNVITAEELLAKIQEFASAK